MRKNQGYFRNLIEICPNNRWPSTKKTVLKTFKQFKGHRIIKKKNVRDQNLNYLKGEEPNEILTLSKK